MLTFTRSVSTSAPIDAVYDYLADFTNVNDWDPRTTTAERVLGDGSAGSVYTCRLFHLGRSTSMTFTMVSLDRPTEIQWVGRSRYLTQRDVLRLEPHPWGSTTVTCHSFFCYPAIYGSREALLTMPLRQLCDRRQRGLQTALDRLAQLTAAALDTPA